MPVPRITANQFEALLAGDINRRDSTVDTTMGPVKDLVIRPVARIFENQNDRVRSLYQLIAQQNVENLQDADMDAFVYTEQILRSQGTPAFTTLTFSRVSKPTSNLNVSANFPVGTEPDSLTGSTITFITLEPASLVAAIADSYYNPTTQRYELQVQAASTVSGLSTKVGRNRVTRPLLPLPGFDSVTNKDEAIGGLAAETNAMLSERYYLRIQGTEIGPPAGLARYVRQTFANVQDTLVVYGNDPTLDRAAYDAGAVDVWVLGSSPVTRTMSVEFPGRLVTIPFDRQPGILVVSVQGIVGYVEGTDYEYVADSGIYSRSTRGRDGIRFLATGAAPAIGETITISYQYDNLIVALQSYFGTIDLKETGRDELFRMGIVVPIAIQGVLKVRTGNPQTVLSNVNQVLLDTLNGSDTEPGYKLGQGVELFDLNAAMSRIAGVDNFTYALLAPVGSSGVGDIPIANKEYARLDQADLAITLA